MNNRANLILGVPTEEERKKSGDKLFPDGRCKHIKSDLEMTHAVAKELNKLADKFKDASIDMAERAAAAREFLELHTDSVRASWLDWRDESVKVMEDIRQTRVAIGHESAKLLAECGDVRKFFLSDDHEKEIVKLREFIELCERLRSLKNDGTLDKLADTILKLA
jgi:methionine synthase II (cobalamin-independent)